jgi:hypothetical protein
MFLNLDQVINNDKGAKKINKSGPMKLNVGYLLDGHEIKTPMNNFNSSTINNTQIDLSLCALYFQLLSGINVSHDT